MSMMSLSGAKFNIGVFSISSCSKVNFFLVNDKTLITFYSSQKEIYFWARGNGKNGYIKFCLHLATSSTSSVSTCPRLPPRQFLQYLRSERKNINHCSKKTQENFLIKFGFRKTSKLLMKDKDSSKIIG